MEGQPLDAGGDMMALRCPRCFAVDDAHDCVPPDAYTQHSADAARKQYEIDYVKDSSYGGGKRDQEVRREVPDEKARLISSFLKEQPAVHGLNRELHSPVLDIDFPCRLVPSTTPGHFHLYLDGLIIPTDKYIDLLTALANAGVIERGYAEAGIRRGATFVWKPGKKPPEAAR